jgi:hypothetical protein
VGKVDDVIWLGNILLGDMAKQVPQNDLPALKTLVDSILQSPPDEDKLWPRYVELQKEMSEILFRGNVEKARHLSNCMRLAWDVERFAGFAWYALQMGIVERKQRERKSGGRGQT